MILKEKVKENSLDEKLTLTYAMQLFHHDILCTASLLFFLFSSLVRDNLKLRKMGLYNNKSN